MIINGLAPPIKFPILCGIDVIPEFVSCPNTVFDARNVNSNKLIIR